MHGEEWTQMTEWINTGVWAAPTPTAEVPQPDADGRVRRIP